MRATNLKSSTIRRVLFDEAHARMTLTFVDGRKYVFDGVGLGDYRALCAAPSAGRHFNEHIKGRFPCHRDPPRRVVGD